MIAVLLIVVVGLVGYNLWIAHYLLSDEYEVDERLRKVANYEL